MAKKPDPFDQPSSLMLETIRLVKERKLQDVFFETHIPFYWLNKFAAGVYKNPSVNRVQYLYEHLTNSKLVKDTNQC